MGASAAARWAGRAGLLAFTLLGCAVDDRALEPAPIVSRTRFDAAPLPRSDAAVAAEAAVPAPDGPPAPAPDAGLDGAAPAATSCGDIVREPGRPPLEAIERLATTSDEVRILVYGQAISDGGWWQQVRDWLRAQYPKGNLVMEHHAHGGCASQCLIGREPSPLNGTTLNRVPEDVFAWRPDLVIFDAYGRHDDYETLVTALKTGCAAFDDHPVAAAHCQPDARYPAYHGAEVLLQTYHRSQDGDDATPLPELPPIPDGQWDRWMATVWIPAVAARQGVAVAPIWSLWGEYLRTSKMKAAELLADGDNLNAAGNALMARLTERSLCTVVAR
jgi:hypothetical protein